MRRKTRLTRCLADTRPRPRPVGARATQTRAARIVRVTLLWQLSDGVLVVVATTLRRGASYTDRWFITPSVALRSETDANASAAQSSYVSRAAVRAATLAIDTTYTFSYAIVMRAGTTAWVGSGSVTLTVDDAGSLTDLAAPTRRPPS